MHLRLLAIITVIGLALPLDAQRSGRVTDLAGNGISGAMVEAWAAGRRLAAALTGPDGTFLLPDSATPPGATIAAHRIGYEGATARADGGAILIRLAAAPLMLNGVRVRSEVPRPRCPVRDQPAARALWEEAQLRYTVPAVLPHVRLRADTYEADVARDDIGNLDDLEPRRGGFTSSELAAAVAPDGTFGGVYARRSALVRDHWEYAPLSWGMSPHFLTRGFGAAHSMAIVARRGATTVIGFCPRRRDVPEIEGTLSVGSDGVLQAAAWRYRTPASRSEAGGEADFLPPDPATGRLLLARRGLFWRSWRGGYHFREDHYTDWIVGAEESPARTVAAP